MIIIKISNLTLVLIDLIAISFKLEHLQRNKRIRVKLIKWKMGNFIKNLFLFWREMKGRHCLICNRVFSNTWDLYWIIVSSISIANDYENFIDNQVEWFWYVMPHNFQIGIVRNNCGCDSKPVSLHELYSVIKWQPLQEK